MPQDNRDAVTPIIEDVLRGCATAAHARNLWTALVQSGAPSIQRLAECLLSVIQAGEVCVHARFQKAGGYCMSTIWHQCRCSYGTSQHTTFLRQYLTLYLTPRRSNPPQLNARKGNTYITPLLKFVREWAARMPTNPVLEKEGAEDAASDLLVLLSGWTRQPAKHGRQRALELVVAILERLPSPEAELSKEVGRTSL